MIKEFRRKDLRTFLLELANYQDNLLQTYRNIFIASQTVVISVASLIVAFSKYPFNTTFIFQLIIGVFIISYWKKITYARGLDVSYCHMQLEKVEAGKLKDSTPFRSFKNWQNKKIRDKERELKEYDKSETPNRNIYESYTRKVMGQKLPFIFSIIWILLLSTFVLSLLFY